MTVILPSHSSSITCVAPTNNDALPQQTFLNPVALYRGNICDEDNYNTGTQILGIEGEEKGDQLSVLAVLVTVFRKSLVGCRSTSCELEEQLMEIGVPTNVRHVAHVTFDRFDGFLGLPVEFEPEVSRRPPSASTRVFGVSTESMQLSFDCRGNCVPTILLMMQRRLYSQGGLQSEGIFRINAENGQEEYVREQLNNGMIPENIDVHCLAGLIKAWFRELPRAILDSFSPEQVMLAQSEDDCTHLVSLLPPTEAALLDWAINLMADVAQLEYLNKMSARNIAMVFAPNMTHMSDPMTALMYVVQVMNFLKTLVMKTLREREDSVPDGGCALHLKPPDEDAHHGSLGRVFLEADEVSDQDEQIRVGKEPLSENYNANSMSPTKPETSNSTNCFLGSVESILTDGSDNLSASRLECEKAAVGNGRTQQKNWRTERKSNNVKKESRKPATKSKELSITSRLNSQAERVESWR
ncbi:rho GTPase-activating protein 5-like [Primulina huaijiensis]|uniref:rho GTPase-activating protein 5-like n=1 Tax=Primulina huaijiensis TaxID=1492673 RepID=UPI003CC6FD51